MKLHLVHEELADGIPNGRLNLPNAGNADRVRGGSQDDTLRLVVAFGSSSTTISALVSGRSQERLEDLRNVGPDKADRSAHKPLTTTAKGYITGRKSRNSP
jgi:hypothetical protein